MKVGVLGSGDVAKTLGSGFLKHGHDVTMGTRDPAKLADWAKQNPKGRVASFDAAAKSAELVVLAVKGTAAADALRAAGAANLAGKSIQPKCRGHEVTHGKQPNSQPDTDYNQRPEPASP